ncbi:MAG: 16S rRNA (adenine(1518)-N(6)/adenine(1519)-N(6))-dimethyltransferase RsmA [Polyangiaceae bacterium]
MKSARELLREHGLAPKKSFGQNFLVDGEVLLAIATACVPESERGRAFVVELGAGLGALTSELVARAAKLAAIERDRDLVPVLARELAASVDAGVLAIVEGDAKTVDLTALVAGAPAGAPRVLCGNLPYQLTGPLLERAVQHAALFDRAVFLVQKEVADRLAAEPSTKDYGALTVFVQAAFAVRKLRLVKPGSFLPPPEVTSAVVVLDSRRPPITEETERFRSLVRAAFGARRKTLRNAWSRLGDDVLAAAPSVGISLDARGETLSVEDFARLARALG